MAEFKDLGLAPTILEALSKKGYTTPTPIQEQAITPVIEGRDLIALSQTGSGKTAAFCLPLLHNLSTNKKKMKPFHTRSLILVPTRELAMQVEQSLKDYGKGLALNTVSVFGGSSRKMQVKDLSKGVQLLVATPGRLLDLMNEDQVFFDELEYLILDEADRMLDMGFQNDIEAILAKLPSKKTSLMFSATMAKKVEAIAKDLLNDPLKIEIEEVNTGIERIKQIAYFCREEDKPNFLIKFIKDRNVKNLIVFVKTKSLANKLTRKLADAQIKARAIHSDKQQSERIFVLREFKKGKVDVLVATDIAARGIDVDNIGYIINFHLPNISENYTHRIGRTARAGRRGVAISYVAPEEEKLLKKIERDLKVEIKRKGDK